MSYPEDFHWESLGGKSCTFIKVPKDLIATKSSRHEETLSKVIFNDKDCKWLQKLYS